MRDLANTCYTTYGTSSDFYIRCSLAEASTAAGCASQLQLSWGSLSKEHLGKYSMFGSDEKLQLIKLSFNLFYRGLEIEDYSKNKRSKNSVNW